jgi:hypothetical protein
VHVHEKHAMRAAAANKSSVQAWLLHLEQREVVADFGVEGRSLDRARVELEGKLPEHEQHAP